MSSGEKFFQRSKTEKITISRETLVDIIASWLYATRMVDEANNIDNIVFLNDANFDSVHLELQIKKGKQD
jgi:hypothetical protein